jgi:hypothetical protein
MIKISPTSLVFAIGGALLGSTIDGTGIIIAFAIIGFIIGAFIR